MRRELRYAFVTPLTTKASLTVEPCLASSTIGSVRSSSVSVRSRLDILLKQPEAPQKNGRLLGSRHALSNTTLTKTKRAIRFRHVPATEPQFCDLPDCRLRRTVSIIIRDIIDLTAVDSPAIINLLHVCGNVSANKPQCRGWPAVRKYPSYLLSPSL